MSQMPRDTMQSMPPLSSDAWAGPQGIGGWLALLIVLLGSRVISAIIHIVRNASEASDRWEVAGGALLLAGFGATSGYTAIALAGKWPRAPRLALVLTRIVAVVALFGAVVQLILYGISPEVVPWVAEAVIQLAWGAYLLRSRRVKNTYAQEASAAPPLRAAVRVGAVLFAAALVWLGMSQHAAAQRQIDEQYAALAPDAWFKAAQRMDPQYTQRFADDAVAQARSDIPNSTITTWVPATFTELPSAVRVVVWYTAEIGDATGGTTVHEAELRSYFHAHGVAQITSWCAPSTVDCSRMQRLLAEAEGALVTRFYGSQMSGILPDGNCSLALTPGPKHQAPIEAMTCRYTESGAASLSLTRSDLATASRDLRSRVDATPEFKRAMVSHVSQSITARRPAS